MRHVSDTQKILDAAAAVGVSAPMLVEDFTHIVLGIFSSATATFTVKFQGSIQQAKPDFAAAQTPTNAWDYIQVRDLEDASALDGDTGLVVANGDSRQFEANVNGLRWFSAVITDYTDGSVTVLAKCFEAGNS